MVLHELESDREIDLNSCRSMYIEKPYNRVMECKYSLPISPNYLFLNGIKMINPFSNNPFLFFEKNFKEIIPSNFKIIHGDPTISNILINSEETYLIDPRGKFGDSFIYGDPYYDISKFYYSVCGGYELINKNKFILTQQNQTSFAISPWPLSSISTLAFDVFCDMFNPSEIDRIKRIESLIWLSLTGYVKDSYDAMLASFLIGLYKIQPFLKSDSILERSVK